MLSLEQELGHGFGTTFYILYGSRSHIWNAIGGVIRPRIMDGDESG